MIKTIAALLLCAGVASAQYLVTPATTPYAPIGSAPTAVLMATLDGCDDCVETVPLSFPFPWFGQALTSVNVTSNGAIIMDGGTGSLCCGALPLSDTSVSRISFAQEDLDPFGTGTTWYLDTGISMIISFEGTSFFPGPASGGMEVQVELFITGDIEIRYGTSNALTNNIAAGISDPAGQVSPNSILPEFSADGVTTGGVVPQNTGVRFVTSPPVFQVNQPGASLDFDGVQGTGFTPAVTQISTAGSATVNFSSTASPTQAETVINIGAAAPGIPVTTGGQILNLSLAGALYLNGGTVPVFGPFANFSVPVSSAAPVVVSGQLFAFDAANADGISISQAATLDVGSPSTARFAGPTADDGTLEIFFGAAPALGPASVQFAGTTYSSLFINSNGRLTFGAADGDFSPTAGEALTDNPSVGHWTDYNPGAGGVIEWFVTANAVQVEWVGVPHFGETNANNMSINIDDAGVVNMDVSGLAANPLTGTSFGTGDAVWFGLSGGSTLGATDPGLTPFTTGGSGANALPTDAIYDFIDSAGIATTTVPGQIDSVTNLQLGLGQLQFIPAGVPGAYLWLGL